MTDLDALHLVPQYLEKWGSYRRKFGKTTYACHCVAGYLEVLKNTTVVVIVHNLDRMDHFLPALEAVLEEHGIEINFYDPYAFRLTFKNNTNMVKFMSLYSMSRMHPADAGSNYDQYPIFDFDYIPAAFYWEDITILNIHMLEKYRGDFNERPGITETRIEDVKRLSEKEVSNLIYQYGRNKCGTKYYDTISRTTENNQRKRNA